MQLEIHMRKRLSQIRRGCRVTVLRTLSVAEGDLKQVETSRKRKNKLLAIELRMWKMALRLLPRASELPSSCKAPLGVTACIQSVCKPVKNFNLLIGESK